VRSGADHTVICTGQHSTDFTEVRESMGASVKNACGRARNQLVAIAFADSAGIFSTDDARRLAGRSARDTRFCTTWGWRFRMRFAHVAIALSTISFVAGSAFATSSIRAFHASPDAPAVDVIVNNASRPIANLAYGNASSFVSVPAATYNLKIVPAGLDAPIVFNGDVPLLDNTTYTVAATGLLGGSPSFAPIVLIDDTTQNTAAARLRFVHASPNAPAVDIALAGGAVLFPNVSFRENGGYINVPGGTYDLEVRIAGTSTVVLPLPGISVTNNQVYTAWAIGLVGNQFTPLSAAVTVDVIPAPGFAGLAAAMGLVAFRRRR
jgi:hypothetical protein